MELCESVERPRGVRVEVKREHEGAHSRIRYSYYILCVCTPHLKMFLSMVGRLSRLAVLRMRWRVVRPLLCPPHSQPHGLRHT